MHIWNTLYMPPKLASNAGISPYLVTASKVLDTKPEAPSSSRPSGARGLAALIVARPIAVAVHQQSQPQQQPQQNQQQQQQGGAPTPSTEIAAARSSNNATPIDGAPTPVSASSTATTATTATATAAGAPSPPSAASSSSVVVSPQPQQFRLVYDVVLARCNALASSSPSATSSAPTGDTTSASASPLLKNAATTLNAAAGGPGKFNSTDVPDVDFIHIATNKGALIRGVSAVALEISNFVVHPEQQAAATAASTAVVSESTASIPASPASVASSVSTNTNAQQAGQPQPPNSGGDSTGNSPAAATPQQQQPPQPTIGSFVVVTTVSDIERSTDDSSSAASPSPSSSSGGASKWRVTSYLINVSTGVVISSGSTDIQVEATVALLRVFSVASFITSAANSSNPSYLPQQQQPQDPANAIPLGSSCSVNVLLSITRASGVRSVLCAEKASHVIPLLVKIERDRPLVAAVPAPQPQATPPQNDSDLHESSPAALSSTTHPVIAAEGSINSNINNASSGNLLLSTEGSATHAPSPPAELKAPEEQQQHQQHMQPLPPVTVTVFSKANSGALVLDALFGSPLLHSVCTELRGPPLAFDAACDGMFAHVALATADGGVYCASAQVSALATVAAAAVTTGSKPAAVEVNLELAVPAHQIQLFWSHPQHQQQQQDDHHHQLTAAVSSNASFAAGSPSMDSSPLMQLLRKIRRAARKVAAGSGSGGGGSAGGGFTAAQAKRIPSTHSIARTDSSSSRVDEHGYSNNYSSSLPIAAPPPPHQQQQGKASSTAAKGSGANAAAGTPSQSPGKINWIRSGGVVTLDANGHVSILRCVFDESASASASASLWMTQTHVFTRRAASLAVSRTLDASGALWMTAATTDGELRYFSCEFAAAATSAEHQQHQQQQQQQLGASGSSILAPAAALSPSTSSPSCVLVSPCSTLALNRTPAMLLPLEADVIRAGVGAWPGCVALNDDVICSTLVEAISLEIAETFANSVGFLESVLV